MQTPLKKQPPGNCMCYTFGLLQNYTWIQHISLNFDGFSSDKNNKHRLLS